MKPTRKVIRRIVVMLLALAAFVLPGEAFAQGGTWTTKAPMSRQRYLGGVAVVNGILYAVGGSDCCGAVAEVEAYNPLTNTWTTKAAMPTPRSALGVGVMNGIVYAVGGIDSSGTILATVEAYDPGTNTWATKAPMPMARGYLAVGVVNGMLYAVGGQNSSYGDVDTVEAYAPGTNTWTTKTAMSIRPRSYLGVGVVNGTLYAAGGANPADGSTCCGYLTTVEAYDAAENMWTPKTGMSTPRMGLGVGELNGLLFAVGGAHPPPDDSGILDTVEAYDPATNTWIPQTSMPTRRFGLAVGVVNGILYAVGGTNANEAFTPEGTPPTVSVMITSLITTVTSFGFQQGINLLQNALSQVNRGNTGAACNQMGAFINQVQAQAGKKLTSNQATQLILAATQVRAALGCS